MQIYYLWRESRGCQKFQVVTSKNSLMYSLTSNDRPTIFNITFENDPAFSNNFFLQEPHFSDGMSYFSEPGTKERRAFVYLTKLRLNEIQMHNNLLVIIRMSEVK